MKKNEGNFKLNCKKFSQEIISWMYSKFALKMNMFIRLMNLWVYLGSKQQSSNVNLFKIAWPAIQLNTSFIW